MDGGIEEIVRADHNEFATSAAHSIDAVRCQGCQLYQEDRSNIVVHANWFHRRPADLRPHRIRRAASVLLALTSALGATRADAAQADQSELPFGKSRRNDAGALEVQRTKDRAWMVRIPAGPYAQRPYEGDGTSRDPHDVPVEAFLIDKNEVTNAQFVRFLNDRFPNGDYQTDPPLVIPRGEGLHLVTGTAVLADSSHTDYQWVATPGRESHPVTAATGFGALAYAEWIGGRIPNRSEWEKAAGGIDGQVYPWGDTPPSSTHANFGRPAARGTQPVGSYPAGASPFGLLDMAGNAYDRVVDSRRGGAPVVIKGGSWLSPHPLNLRVLDMCVQPMGVADRSVGFRCAMDDPGVAVLTGSPKRLRVAHDFDEAIEEATERQVPIFLSLHYDTCGQCDRTRAQLFTDPRFIDYCNENLVVVVGHDPGDALLDPHPEGDDGRCPFYPDLECWEHLHIFRQAMQYVRDFQISPGNFVLDPNHCNLNTAPDQRRLIAERELSKWGNDVDGYLDAFERARAMLRERTR